LLNIFQENTTTKRNAQQGLIAKTVVVESTTIKLERLIAKIVERGNTMIKRNAQQRLSAKIVELGNTMIKLERLSAKIVELGNIMIKLKRLIAKNVELENTTIKRNAQQRLIVKLIATPDHTFYLTKLRVSFVRKVSGKIKMERQIVKIVEKEDTMI